MQSSSILTDTEKIQLLDEFKDPNTEVSRKNTVAKHLLEDIIRKECPKLIARAEDGEQLSDRELALLSYNGDIDEDLQKQIYERKISSVIGEKYVAEFLEVRVSKQLALQSTKESVDVGIYLYKMGWPALKAALPSTAEGLNLGQLVSNVQNAQFWKINFIASGALVLFDLSHSLYLFWNKKIDGKAVVKRLTSSLASNGSGIAGAHVVGAMGALIGAAFGPIGLIAGGIIGGLVGGIGFALLGKFLNDKVWEYFEGNYEDKAREELLASARETLGVLKADDFKKITRQWRKMVLEYHPDKRPNADEEEKKIFGVKFQEVHLSYNILREEEKRKGTLKPCEIERISKSSAILVIKDGFVDDDD